MWCGSGKIYVQLNKSGEVTPILNPSIVYIPGIVPTLTNALNAARPIRIEKNAVLSQRRRHHGVLVRGPMVRYTLAFKMRMAISGLVQKRSRREPATAKAR